VTAILFGAPGLLTGQSTGRGTSIDILTVKLGPEGDTIWTRRWNGAQNQADRGWCITADARGRVYVGGTTVTAFRNGAGGNTPFYTAISDARLGGDWVTQVSHSHHPGASATLILGRTAAANGPVLGPGEILIGGAKLFRHSVPSSGTSDLHSLPVPVDLAFIGLTAYTQALIIGGGAELGNALDATAGL